MINSYFNKTEYVILYIFKKLYIFFPSNAESMKTLDFFFWLHTHKIVRFNVNL